MQDSSVQSVESENIKEFDVKGSKQGWWVSILATFLLVVIIVLLAASAWYGMHAPVKPWRVSDAVFGISLLAYAAVGWLITVRLSNNSLGWIYLIMLVIGGLGALSEEFALRASQSGPDSSVALWLIAATWLTYLAYFMLNGPAFILFPDGRYPGKIFRWVLWGLASLFVISGLISIVSAEMICVRRVDETGSACLRFVENPLGLVRYAGLRDGVEALISVVLILALGISLAAIVVRYWKSSGEVRQQIKWVAWIAGVSAPILLVYYGGQVLGIIPGNEWSELPYFLVLSVGMPVAIGIAIFKHHLYDIDRIISRTAAYTLITILLAAVYFGVVTLTQRILPVKSQLDIVLSTLVVAALFNPLRRFVQSAVDRRFYRRKYDAERVLAEFGTTARDELDIDNLVGVLLNVVEETMQPKKVSLWLMDFNGMGHETDLQGNENPM